MGRGGSKKYKPIPAPPRDAGLKSQPIPAPPPLRGGENPHGAKRGGAKLPSLVSESLFWSFGITSILSFSMLLFTVAVILLQSLLQPLEPLKWLCFNLLNCERFAAIRVPTRRFKLRHLDPCTTYYLCMYPYALTTRSLPRVHPGCWHQHLSSTLLPRQ